MWFYRRHQQRYNLFGADGKSKVDFMELVDGGAAFSDDALHFEHVSYVLGTNFLPLPPLAVDQKSHYALLGGAHALVDPCTARAEAARPRRRQGAAA